MDFISSYAVFGAIGVAMEDQTDHAPLHFWHILWLCASRDGVPNQILLFAKSQNFDPSIFGLVTLLFRAQDKENSSIVFGLKS